MDSIAKAFNKIERKDFVPEYLQNSVNYDAPLPIGFSQTISQPTTVELMLGWLELEPGNKVLDVGSGSGWTTALLSKIVGPKGRVYAVEKIPELVEFGRQNCQKYNLKNVKFFLATNKLGLKKFAPYDRILVSATSRELPNDLLNQLKISGKMVIPVNNDILEITKTTSNDYEILTHPGFVFVPMV